MRCGKEWSLGSYCKEGSIPCPDCNDESIKQEERERILKIIDNYKVAQEESGYEFADIVVSVKILKDAVCTLSESTVAVVALFPKH